MLGSYRRVDSNWSSEGNFFGGPAEWNLFGGPDWGGALAPPGAADGMEGAAITKGGWETRSGNHPGDGQPAIVVWGWHSPAVVQLSLVQGGRREVCPSGHYGAWIVGIESDETWRIEGHDQSDTLLGFVDMHFNGRP